jgi:hypothetical protein
MPKINEKKHRHKWRLPESLKGLISKLSTYTQACARCGETRQKKRNQ